MIVVLTDSEEEAVLVIDGLVAAAEHEDGCSGDRLRARRYRRLADSIADQLEAVTRSARGDR